MPASLSTVLAASAAVASVPLLLVWALSGAARRALASQLTSASAGLLLGVALLGLLPDAFESGAPPQGLFATLLGGLLLFFVLEKLHLYRHDHHHESDGHAHRPGFAAARCGPGGRTIIVADAMHAFCDGALMAASFLVDMRLGAAVFLSVFTHELALKTATFLVLTQAGLTRLRALRWLACAGLACLAGGWIGFHLVGLLRPWIPHLLVLAASNLLYVSLADLLPRLQQPMPWDQTVRQLSALGLGLVFVSTLVILLGHGH